MEGISSDHLQNLTSESGTRLANNGRTLSDYRIWEQSTLSLSLRQNANLRPREGAMRIFVDFWDGRTISLDVASRNTPEDLYAMIYHQEGIPPDEMKLIAKGGRQIHYGQTLSDAGVQTNDTLHLSPRLPPRIESIRMPGGTFFALRAGYGDTVQCLMDRIQDKEGIHPNKQRLYYNGKQLYHKLRILNCGIGAFPTLKLLVRREGDIEEERDSLMRICVKTMKGNKITAKIPRWFDVHDLKALIQFDVGYRPELQRLTLDGRVLENARSLSDYDIQENSTLDLSAVWPGERMRIFVKTITGRMVAFDVESGDTIENVKAKIQGRLEIPTSCQHLTSEGGLTLKDEWTLSEYNIQEDSTLHLSLIQRGGSLQISVKSWEGIEIALEVVGGLTIACVNAMIEQKMEIRADLQSLTFDGWRLEDTRTLSDYDIQQHSQLDLSLNLQLRGAMQT